MFYNLSNVFCMICIFIIRNKLWFLYKWSSVFYFIFNWRALHIFHSNSSKKVGFMDSPWGPHGPYPPMWTPKWPHEPCNLFVTCYFPPIPFLLTFLVSVFCFTLLPFLMNAKPPQFHPAFALESNIWNLLISYLPYSVRLDLNTLFCRVCKLKNSSTKSLSSLINFDSNEARDHSYSLWN